MEHWANKYLLNTYYVLGIAHGIGIRQWVTTSPYPPGVETWKQIMKMFSCFIPTVFLYHADIFFGVGLVVSRGG